MRHLVSLLFLILTSSVGFAQSDAQELERLCNEAENLMELNPKLALQKADELLAFASKKFPANDTNTAIAYLSHALINSFGSKPKSYALGYAEKAIQLLENFKQTNPRLYVNSFYYLGSIYFYYSDLENALKWQRNALELAEISGNFTLEELLIYTNNLMEIYSQKGDIYECHALLEKAERLVEKDEISLPIKLGFYNTTANYYSSISEFEKAEKILQKAISYAKNHNLTESKTYFELINNYGLNQFELGKSDASISQFNYLIQLLESQNITNSDIYFSALNSLGVVYAEKGNRKKSDSLQSVALKKRLELVGENHPSYWKSLLNYATYLHEIGDIDKSISTYRKLKSLMEKNNSTDSDSYQILVNNLAIVLMNVNVQKFQEAKQILETSLKKIEKKRGKNDPRYWESYNLLSSVFIGLKDYDNAEKIYNEYIKFLLKEKNTNILDLSTAYHNLSEFYFYQNPNLSKAIQYNLKAEETLLEGYTENHPNIIPIYGTRTQINIANRDYEQALHTYKLLFKQLDKHILEYFSHLSERQKINFYQDYYNYYRSFYSFAFKNLQLSDEWKELVANNALNKIAFTLKHSKQLRFVIGTSNNPQLEKAFIEWKNKKTQLSTAKNLTKKEINSSGINIEVLANEIEQLEKELASVSYEFQKNWLKEISWKNVQEGLQANEAFVQIIKTNIFNKIWTDTVVYAAVIITKNSPKPIIIELFSGKKIEKKYLRYYQNTIATKREKSQSYNFLWQKIDSIIGGKSTIYLVPDGIYNKINPNTLQSPDGKYIIEKSFIHLLNDINGSVAPQKTTKKKTATLIGNPNYNFNILNNKDEILLATSGNKGLNEFLRSSSNSVNDLPGTKKEVENINKILKSKGFSTKLLTEDEAQESNLKKHSNSDIIHLATHGYFDLSEIDSTSLISEKEYFSSGILLAGSNYYLNGLINEQIEQDGIISAYEIVNLDLQNTELVVLSACETGLGVEINGNGVFGLQRALSIAGAKNIIMSLWKVSDEATSELMSEFYQSYTQNQNIPESFRKAQIKLKEKYPDPYYWGAFVLLSNK